MEPIQFESFIQKSIEAKKKKKLDKIKQVLLKYH
jgi:hypothetical protein